MVVLIFKKMHSGVRTSNLILNKSCLALSKSPFGVTLWPLTNSESGRSERNYPQFEFFTSQNVRSASRLLNITIMLRFKTDIRTLVFMFITAGTLVLLWQFGSEMATPLWILCYTVQLLMAVIVSTMVHNHQHLPMWTSKGLNTFTDSFLTVFYGFPVFAWIPTHNSNHHVHINKEPDYTKTYMLSEKNNLLTLLTYPSISGMAQQKAVGKYLVGLYKYDRRKFYMHLLQIVSLIAWITIALAIDWKKAIVYVIIPQQLSLFAVLMFNYIQHIHADEESEFNHSRNMTGKVLNYLLLNNGLHTAHHISPGAHWSQLREKHDKIAHKIDPRLNEDNFAWYLFRVYILGLFSPSFHTENMRMERMQNLTSTSSN